jgi:hypothetical protein
MNNEQMPDNRLLDADGSGRVLPDGEPDKPIARMGYSGDVRAAAELIFDEAMVAVSFHDVDVAEEIIRDQRHRASQQAQARINELTGEVERLWEALRPFYAFGAVLKTATEENGYDWVSLFTGTVEPVPAEEGEVTYDILEPESCIVDVHAGWSKTPATYCGPILRAKHFFEAAAAFMSVERLVEKDNLCQALEKGEAID